MHSPTAVLAVKCIKSWIVAVVYGSFAGEVPREEASYSTSSEGCN